MSKPAKVSKATQYNVIDLPKLGFVVIDWIGQENMYFTLADGTRGYVKL